MSTLLSTAKSFGATFAIVVMATAATPASVYAASQNGLAHGNGNGLTKTQASQNTTTQTTTERKSTQTTQGNSQTGLQQSSSTQPKGNNGTLKIHESGTPSGTENNDPKVCSFNVEGFGFDASQSGYLQFDVQGGDKPTGAASGPHAFGVTSASGYYASQYFSLADGHYKATLYGKMLPGGQLSDVKAKSKVFKVECTHTAPCPPTCPAHTMWKDTNKNKKVDTGECVTPTPGKGSAETPTTSQVLGTNSTIPVVTPIAPTAQLANTGQSTVVAMIAGIMSIVTALGLALGFKSKTSNK